MFHNGISTCLLNDSDMDPMDEIMQPARAAKVVNKVGEESYLTSSWLCAHVRPRPDPVQHYILELSLFISAALSSRCPTS